VVFFGQVPFPGVLHLSVPASVPHFASPVKDDEVVLTNKYSRVQVFNKIKIASNSAQRKI